VVALNPSNHLLKQLEGQRVYLDSCIFIYFLERDAKRFDLVSTLMQGCSAQKIFAFTGAAAVAEVMVKPYRHGDANAIWQTEQFLAQPRFLTFCEHPLTLFLLAAKAAGERKMKLVDALHYVTAQQNDCAFLITNDRAYKSDDSITVIQLDELISANTNL
jgi:predicted nucleic acid-binding protein